MKRILLLFVILLTYKVSRGQYVYIPDPIFRNYINTLVPGAIYGDSLNTGDGDIYYVNTMNVPGLGITSLQGVQYFYNLVRLNASNNLLPSLPPLPSGLLYLNIDSNPLFTFGLGSPAPALTQLYCNNCSLYQLPPLSAGLQILDCRNNHLLCLPELPSSLDTLRVANNYFNCIPNLPTVTGFYSDVGTAICGAGTCNRFDTISGSAFMDLNDNGIWDPGEPALSNQPITIQPAFNTVITDSNGYYYFLGHPDIMQTIKPHSLPYAVFAPDSFNILLANPLADTGNLNFGFHFIDTFSDARVFATEVIRAIPGQMAEYNLAVNNHGTRTENGTLIFIMDPHFTYNSSLPAAVLSADTLKWNFSNLLPGVSLEYNVQLKVNGLAALGTLFYDTAYVSIINHDSFPANNLAVIIDTIVGTYQRNNKTASSTTYTAVSYAAGDYFDYTITFQNLDTDTVTNVWLIDTLSQYFDMSSLYVVAASAPYALTISGNALRVDFNNIELPDSAVNPVGSHGFFRFRIRPLPVTYLGNIHNIAYIYFERNGVIEEYTGGIGGPGVNVCLSMLNIYVTSTGDTFSLCLPEVKGRAKAIVTTGTAPYTYLWNTGAVTDSIGNLNWGQYYVTVIDQCLTTAVGIPYVDSVWNDSIVVTVVDTGSLCSGDSNGSALLTACGAGPFSFIWNNGDTGAYVNHLAGGNIYYCTVTDSSGDTSIITIYIPNRDSVVINLSAQNCSLFGVTSPGEAIVSPQGGYPPFQVMWSNGQIGTQASNLQTGNYYVTVTDSVGCSAVDSFTLNVMSFSYLEFATPFCTNSDIYLGFSEYNAQDILFYTGPDFNADYTNIPENPWGGEQPLPPDDIVQVIMTNASPNGGTCSIDTQLYIPQAEFYDDTIINPLAPVGCADSGNTLLVRINGYYHDDDLSYSWSNGATTDAIYNVPPGVYSCTADGGYYECIFTMTGTVRATDSIKILSDSVQNASCYGDNNGAIIISPATPGKIAGYAWSNGESGAIDSLLPPGNYACPITDTLGCSRNQYFTITQPDSLSALANIRNIVCSSLLAPSIQLIVSGGTPGYSYQWSNNEYSSDDTLLTPGSYSCTISDANNCTLIDSFTVAQTTVDSLVVSVVAIQNVSCSGGSNGSIELSAYNGIGSYAYSWSNSERSATNAALVAGAYTCTITDSLGCSVQSTDTVAQPMPILPDISASPILCYGDTSNISLTVSGGTPPFSFTGLNGFTQPAGTYIVNITDSNGCTDADTLVITQPAVVGVNTDTVQNARCYDGNDGSITITATGGVGNYSYLWSNNEQTAEDTMISAGNYFCTITDANGCIFYDTVSVAQPDSLSSLANVTNGQCLSDAVSSIQLAASGGTPGYTYQWSNNEYASDDTLLLPGGYTFTVSDANNCTLAGSIIIAPFTVDSLAVSVIAIQNAVCNGDSNGSIQLSAHNGVGSYIYSWSNHQYSAIDSALFAGVYVCTVTDSMGCTVQSANTVTQPMPILPDISASPILCYGDTSNISLTISGGTPPFSFTGLNGFTQPAGTYIVNITDSNGCTVADTIVITQPDSLSISASIQNAGCSASVTGSIQLTVSGGTLGYSYRWNNNEYSADDTLLTSGSYSCTISDANSCMLSDSFTILEAPDDFLSVSIIGIQNVSCNGGNNGSITISAINGIGGYTYNWNNGEHSAIDSALTTGVYSCTITDSLGCTVQSANTIAQPQQLNVRNVISGFCFGDTPMVSYIITGGFPPYLIVGVDSLDYPPEVYFVNFTDSVGCSILDSFSIEPDSLNAFFTTKFPSCNNANGSIALDSVVGNAPPYTFIWSNGDSSTGIANLSTGVYSLTISDTNGCEYTYSDTITCVTGITNVEADEDISVYPNPASTALNIVASGNYYYQLQLRDITGRLVIQLYFAQSTVLDVATLPRGVYLAEVRSRNNEQAAVKKIVLQ